ncbi:UDP-3-O-(3-hydroxymyristoyl)glucosamine N-acyltransferase [Marinobacter daepoensis]|uniref:UDP-3-O-acylglucosamine N-acyltransferase n=1 Tax=Marinobacter daepoensis TaxID=262077 RepID=A0ABS3BDZ7_9GAMM|nr:UDP-3-O-(3-hydroxymyristoyl)glucosamine N-acyltransferase [Marinobacter daepoensis]MBN7770059.1 UDP-3-O-(3-hydroxymyristoyl)glucosamine N-acyltransferase [Marinobacter daepoensis]MBY6034784.1 UDP-3-O-(3-hydroxymyristoyl)glucosamine N-acyltransferase [Marinobacter daepoensis]MBY6080773.1 UDP-3-O-(3-hydroxymyristoyl)glucosamine N-acyltransferase [Marinobacter daepoensis]
MTQKSYRLQEIAEVLGASLRGDPDTLISGLATLQAAGPGQISFLANPSYAKYLKDTEASAVIVSNAMADDVPTNVLLLDNPYLGYAHLSHWFDPAPKALPGVHPTAVVDETVCLPPSVSIGPHAVIEAGARIGERVVVGAGCFVGARSCIGDDTLLRPRVTIAHDVVMGQRCHILSGAVIGSDGFGFANEKGAWHRIAQLGGVVLGDDVEVGANTTIDRGALDSTVIGNGVKLDNLIQIAHNVQIGDHSAMAAKVGIAGSTRVGEHCVFGGASGVAGHLEIASQVHLTGMTLVTGDIREPGVYSSGTSADTNRQWRKNAVRFRQLDALARRIKELEKKLEG